MATHYYIDGYNVLHKSALLRPLLEVSFETAREALVDKVALFASTTGYPVTIVFDGRRKTYGEAADHGRPVQGYEVVYTRGDVSADGWIERMVYKADTRRSIVVVSGDRGIRDQCSGMGAMVMDADNFLKTIAGMRQEIDRAMDHRKEQHASMSSIEDRLGGDSLSALQELRKKLK
jgi:predicted RNA-binding protein with PIN domain